jgi:hypothetical protein
VESAVRLIARSLDFPCAERLQPARLDRARRGLVPMGQALASHGELELSPDLLERLGRISVSTVGRMVQRMRRDGHLPRLARRRPPQRNPSFDWAHDCEPAEQLTRPIPAGRLPRDLPEPGHFEVDLVYHAGDSASGQYVHTLQLIDVTSGWSEWLGRLAMYGSPSWAAATLSCKMPLPASPGLQGRLARLPFPMLELHPDNGAEFFNHFLLTYWKQAVPHLTPPAPVPSTVRQAHHAIEGSFSPR